MKKINKLMVLVLLTISTMYVSAKDKELFTFRIPTQTGFNEFDIADELGYFKDEGIQIKYIGLVPDAGKAIQATITDNSDIFTGHPNTVVRAKLAGVKVVIISPGMVDHPEYIHMGYFVKETSNLKTPADVNKKIKVAVSSINSCTDLIALEWARINKIPQDNLQFVIMPDDQQEQSLKQGLVELIDLHPPYIKRIKENGGARLLFTSWEVVGSPAGGSSIRGVSEKFAKAHPKELTGFIRAIVKAHHWINDNQQAAIDIIAKRLNFDPKKVNVFFYDENDWIQESYMLTWISAMERNNQISKGEIKPSDIYTNAYNPYYLARDKTKDTNYVDKNIEKLAKYAKS